MAIQLRSAGQAKGGENVRFLEFDRDKRYLRLQTTPFVPDFERIRSKILFEPRHPAFWSECITDCAWILRTISAVVSKVRAWKSQNLTEKTEFSLQEIVETPVRYELE